MRFARNDNEDGVESGRGWTGGVAVLTREYGATSSPASSQVLSASTADSAAPSNMRDLETSIEQNHFAMLNTKQIITNNVLWKRKEQLAKWETSETNRVPSMRKSPKDFRVQFTESDVFLSACLSGDLDEVQSLLDNGADINTCTVDGLTALHQAVIDGKPEMVQFLADNGADLNAQDNEGWTPLHAAACCGNADLVAYLCAEGADISITNSDKELAVDLAEEDDCRMVLEDEHRRRNIDPDECRNREFAIMKRDAEKWLREGYFADRPHARTGASAIHVAAAKGYIDVLKLLVKAGADVNCRDREGWTPLHAAAHWGEREAASLLVQNGASLDALTNNEETVLNVADKDIVEYLEGLQEKERARLASSNNVNVLVQANTPLKRAGSATSVLRLSTEEKLKKTKLDEQDENKDLRDKYSLIIEEKSPSPSVELRLPCPPYRESSETPSELDRSTKSSSVSSSEKSSLVSPEREISEEKAPEAQRSETESELSQKEINPSREVVPEKAAEQPAEPTTVAQPKAPIASVPHSEVVLRSPKEEVASSSTLIRPLRVGESRVEAKNGSSFQRDSSTSSAVTPLDSPSTKKSLLPNVQRCSSTPSTLPWMALYRNSSTGPTHPAFAQFQSAVRNSAPNIVNKQTSLINQSTLSTTSVTSQSPLTRTSLLTPPTEPNFPKESEAERRSKAKRQRDSRRSTQGVTKEQIKAASLSAAVHRDEKENEVSWTGPLRRDLSKDSSSSSKESTPSEKTPAGAGEGTSVLTTKQDFGSEASVSSNSSIPNVRRRSQAPRGARRGTGPVSLDDVQSAFHTMGVNQKAPTETTTASAAVSTVSHATTVTASTSTAPTNSVTRVVVSLRDRPTPTPQVAITHTSPPLRLNNVPFRGSSVGAYQKLPYVTSQAPQDTTDYKALYEKEKAENEKLRGELATAEKSNTLNGSASLFRRGLGKLGQSSVIKSSSSSSLDEQERKTLERRIAELEFEVKQLEHLRSDNKKLKEENGALIRVISKLSK